MVDFTGGCSEMYELKKVGTGSQSIEKYSIIKKNDTSSS
jgi:hypothetical protein